MSPDYERSPIVTPYGLTREIRLPDTFAREIPGAEYDPRLQLSVVGGVPMADQPAVLATWTTTWGTARNDNASDDESR
jgi:hypothetical protein